MKLVLASKSPRRRELMHLITPRFEAVAPDVDEGGISAATPVALVQALGVAKARWASLLPEHAACAVIGCDTVVELEGEAIGKPRTPQQAIDMLTSLAGTNHFVHTGVAVFLPEGTEPACFFVETTKVTLAAISPDEIAAYAATDEPYDKAGGYGIQGWAARYFTRIEGCFYNIMGLPVPSLYVALRDLGLV